MFGSIARRTSSFTTSVLINSKRTFWELGKLNHVAIAVPDLKKSSDLYKNVFCAKVSEPVGQPEHGVYTVFVEMGTGAKIELLGEHKESGVNTIGNFLAKNPAGGIHHICLEVSDLKEAIKTLKDKKVRTLSENTKIGAHGKPVIFLHPKDCNGVLVELEEHSKND